MRDDRTFVVWDEALRFVRERDLDGYAGTFVPCDVVELPMPLPGMPRPERREEIRRVLAPVWRAVPAVAHRVEKSDTGLVQGTPDTGAIVIEFDVHGVEASGMPYRLSYVHVVAVRDGRIATLRDDPDHGAIRPRAQSASDEANKALVRRYFSMCDAGDFDRIDRLLAPGYVDHARPELADPTGHVDEARLFVATNPGATVTIDTLVADGALVAARTTLRCTRGGKAFVRSGMAFFRVSDGKLAEQWSCYPRGA